MLERKNPLPVGRYWVDVPGSYLGTFQAWLADRQEQIHVDATGERQASGTLTSPGVSITWYAFTVKSPVPWFGPGTPTIADSSITSIDDTVSRPPPPPSFIDQMFGASGTVPTIAKYALWGGAAVLGGVALWKLFQIVDFAPPK